MTVWSTVAGVTTVDSVYRNLGGKRLRHRQRASFVLWRKGGFRLHAGKTGGRNDATK